MSTPVRGGNVVFTLEGLALCVIAIVLVIALFAGWNLN